MAAARERDTRPERYKRKPIIMCVIAADGPSISTVANTSIPMSRARRRRQRRPTRFSFSIEILSSSLPSHSQYVSCFVMRCDEPFFTCPIVLLLIESLSITSSMCCCCCCRRFCFLVIMRQPWEMCRNLGSDPIDRWQKVPWKRNNVVNVQRRERSVGRRRRRRLTLFLFFNSLSARAIHFACDFLRFRAPRTSHPSQSKRIDTSKIRRNRYKRSERERVQGSREHSQPSIDSRSIIKHLNRITNNYLRMTIECVFAPAPSSFGSGMSLTMMMERANENLRRNRNHALTRARTHREHIFEWIRLRRECVCAFGIRVHSLCALWRWNGCL